MRTNLGLKSLALVLSLCLWIFVRFTQTPFSSTINQADLQVPLEIATDSDKMVLDAPSYVTVTVRGSKDYIQHMPASAVGAHLDLKGVAEGVGAYKVNVTSPPELTVIQVENERPLLRLEALTHQTFPVEVKVKGRPARGFTPSQPSLVPSSAEVTGPRAYISRIKHVVAPLDVNGMETSLLERAALQAVDDDLQPLTKLEIVPRYAMVSVNITPDIVPRLVPVFPELKGKLGTGLSMQAQWTPRYVPVVFKGGAKAAKLDSLSTAPVEVQALRPGTHTVTLPIVKPDDATLVREQKINLTLTVVSNK
jgi:YbbR domain-containing protein